MTPTFPKNWKVFPCYPGTKEPLSIADMGGSWKDLATDYAPQIEFWASEWPGCNWAVHTGPSGLAVLDVDGEAGEASLFALELEHGELPKTREHVTPRGGRHLIFAGDIKPTVGQIMRTDPEESSHLDTRGRHSYIVIPPSNFDGKPYALSHDRPVVELPDYVAELAGRTREAVSAPSGVNLDSDSAIGRAERLLLDYVERGHVAIEGQGGDDRTYAVCAEVLNLGLSEDKAFELIDTIWNIHCQRPWEKDELRTKIANAGRYAQNEAGAWAVAPIRERIPPEALNKLLAISAEATPVAADADNASLYPRPMKASELANGSFPVPFYAWDNFILAENVNLIYGDGGTGKTLLLLFVAVAIAAGVPLFGHATRQMAVLLALAEDDYGPIEQRLKKICAALGVAREGLPLHIWCLPGRDVNIATVADDGTSTPGPFMAALCAQLAEIGQPVFLGLDGITDFIGLDETKRPAVNSACKKILGGLCRNFSATIAVNAHPSKAAMADGSGYAGSTAWNNSVRSRLTLERPDPKSRQRILRVAKSNYGANAELELHMIDGVFWLRDQGAAAENNDRLMDAAVAAAEAASQQGMPIQRQRKPPKWVYEEIERAAGKRPTQRELLEVLDYAIRAGRIRYLKGTNRRMAGYYPWDEVRAAELAAEAKRHATQVEKLSEAATRREANNG